MDTFFINSIIEFINQATSFLFETYLGITILIGFFLVASLIIAFLLEIKTKKEFVNHPVDEDKNSKTDNKVNNQDQIS